ncbi:MAG: methylenetetrahydrofolate reductase [Thermoleophilia bacterium]|nr:methylenetetrahydrofolate reductase [Thermoleophilia bacterium]
MAPLTVQRPVWPAAPTPATAPDPTRPAAGIATAPVTTANGYAVTTGILPGRNPRARATHQEFRWHRNASVRNPCPGTDGISGTAESINPLLAWPPVSFPTRLETALAEGRFAVTSEMGPPKSADPAIIAAKARLLGPVTDAVNITDNQTAQSRMCPLACGRIALDNGAEPVMQMTVRDRNRMALTSDILGASALGIHNTLSMSGDPIHIGNHPDATVVNDIDTMGLLRLQSSLAAGHFMNATDEELAGEPPHLVIGATAHPAADDPDVEISKIRAKMEAGAAFFQTQLVYEPERVAAFMARLEAADLPAMPKLLIGVGPFKHLRMAEHMRDNVWGVTVPDALITRMRDATDDGEVGMSICVEVIQALREIPGVAGIHVMAIAWEDAVPEILSRAGLA